jgi:proline iminopeptidase
MPKTKKAARSKPKTKKVKKTRKRTPCPKTERERLKALLFPIQKPRTRGHIKVSDLHTVAYYTYGNPDGIPHLFMHGGPGSDINNDITDMFDLKKYFLVAIDQRGCGKSTPAGELRENTTQDLLADMETVRRQLNVKKWILVGFSWGSTLAIYYAQQHADRVRGVLIGGVFLGTARETDYVENGGLVQLVFPEAWERYLSILHGKTDLANPARAYQRKIRGDDGASEQTKALRYYSEFENSIDRLYPLTRTNIAKTRSKTPKNRRAHYAKTGRIFHHYFENGCFFPRDEYLLETRNMKKMAKIPVEIVQGHYDIVAPAIVAHQVHKKLPRSKLHMVVAGHQGIPCEFNKQVIESLRELNK